MRAHTTDKIEEKEEGKKEEDPPISTRPTLGGVEPVGEHKLDLMEKFPSWPSVGFTSPRPKKEVCSVSEGTANKGNGHIVARLTTASFPLCRILMGLSAQLEVRGMLLDLHRERR